MTIENSRNNRTGSSVVLPEVRYHPSIQIQTWTQTQTQIWTPKLSKKTQTSKSSAQNTRGDLKSKTSQNKILLIPQVRYHPSINTTWAQMHKQRNQEEKTSSTKAVECLQMMSRKSDNGDKSEKDLRRRSFKMPQSHRGTGEGSGECEIGPKREPPSGSNEDQTQTAFSAEDPGGVLQDSPQKETRRKSKKSRKVPVSQSGAGCKIEPKEEQTDGSKEESGKKCENAKPKTTKSQKSNDRNSAQDQKLDPDLLQARPGLSLDPDLVAQVEALTRGQRTNPDWFRFRQNRITASVAHQISHCLFVNGKSSSPPQSYIRSILGKSGRVQTRAMSWGIEHEREAVLKYQEQQSAALGRSVLVLDCGLFIDGARPWLAASPDGIVTDAKTGEWLRCLEVKCPFKHKDTTVAMATETDKDFCLQKTGQKQFSLKTSHPYFTQVQCQLAVTGLKMADFVVFTKKDLVVVPVRFDPDFWDQTVSKLDRFYSEAVVPALRQREPALQPEI